MFGIKMNRLAPFIALAAIQTIFACFILGNELLAINNRVPGGNYPFEYHSSWARVLIFCAGAALCVLAAWVLYVRKQWLPLLPPLKIAMPLTVLPVLAGLVQSHYLTRMGWCCETPIAYFFGFPFSFLHGVWGYDPSITRYADYGLIEILSQPAFVLSWEVDFYRLCLNFLFWSGVIYGLLVAIRIVFQKPKMMTKNN